MLKPLKWGASWQHLNVCCKTQSALCPHCGQYEMIPFLTLGSNSSGPKNARRPVEYRSHCVREIRERPRLLRKLINDPRCLQTFHDQIGFQQCLTMDSWMGSLKSFLMAVCLPTYTQLQRFHAVIIIMVVIGPLLFQHPHLPPVAITTFTIIINVSSVYHQCHVTSMSLSPPVIITPSTSWQFQ